jgi:hypothetical protein
MKKNFLFLIFILSVSFSKINAQNVFPTAAGTNVGIGTTSPSTSLQITSSTAGTSGLRLTNLTSSSATTSGLLSKAMSVDANGNVVLVPVVNTSPSTLYSANGTLASSRLVTMSGRSLTFNPTNANSQFFMNGTSGDIGLGTSFPSSKLHIPTGNITLDSGRSIYGTVGNFNDVTANWAIKSNRPFLIASSTFPAIEIRSTGGNSFGYLNLAIAPVDLGFSNVSKAGDVVLRGYTGGSMILNCEGGGNIKLTTALDNQGSTPSLTRMIVTKTGDVGIGTETPDAKLAVNGVIHSKEVVVDLIGWPDYVFESDYKLMPLEQLEKSIQQNKHLPNIPSATEVEKNGVHLGEMNKKLLQKIEELTLYIIELNKEVEALKAQSKR